MPEVTTRFLADQSYQGTAQNPHTETSAIIDVDDDIRAVRIVYDRQPWTPGGGAGNRIALSWVLEMSRDGRPWRVIGENETYGGVDRDEDNGKIFRARWRKTLPTGPGQVNRRVRITTNIYQDISTWGDLVTLTRRDWLEEPP